MKYKHDYDKILIRLITILQKLNSRERLNISDLAKEFNVSTKTIHRDLNQRLNGFGIICENKKYFFNSDFKLEKIKNIEDKIVLEILEELSKNISPYFNEKSKNLIQKIKNSDESPFLTKIIIEDISEHIDEISKIEKAIKENTKLSCKYKNYDIEYVVNPYKIINFDGF